MPRGSWRSPLRWLRYPAGTTLALLLASVLIAKYLRAFADDNSTNRVFTGSTEFRVWIGVATLSIDIWIWVFLRGVIRLRKLNRIWPRARRWWAAHVAAYILLGVAVLWFLSLNGIGRTVPVPVDGWAILIRVLVVAGAAAAAPWVILAWFTHEQVHNLAGPIEHLKQADVRPTVREILDAWEIIERCALALGLVVSTAVLITAALRAALLGTHVAAGASFPAIAVLGYGAFFAIVVAVAVVPLVLSWRARAIELVDRVMGEPASGIPDQDWVDCRARLQGRLCIDAPVLRRPITIVGVFAPLATGLLTAFLPHG